VLARRAGDQSEGQRVVEVRLEEVTLDLTVGLLSLSLTCPHCGADMRIVAFITETAPVARMLMHIGEPPQPPPIAPARGPPAWEDDPEPMPDWDLIAQPDPGSGGKAIVFVGERTAGPDRYINHLGATKCLSAYAEYVTTGPRPVSANAGDSLMKVATVFMFIIAAVALTGCGTTTGERTGSGALLGAGTGAAIGSFSGNAGKGALIGAGAGALGGYLYDQDKKQQGQPYYDQNRTRQDQYYYDRNRAQQDQY